MRNPHLYEISTWPWLERLSRGAGSRLTLGRVPAHEWDRLHDLGFDLVYLMGVWRRSAVGRQIARADLRLFGGYDAALPGWTPADIVGSPYSIAEYAPDPRLGDWTDLEAARRELHARGMGLVLDFVPNHTAFDHGWIERHPERYVRGSLEDYRRAPERYRLVETGPDREPQYLALARDPNFPPWTDVAQLDYRNPEARAAMIEQLRGLARRCDAVRCDMAMLVLPEVFSKTWGPGAGGADWDFWTEAHAAAPDLTLVAEAYWDFEWRLQQCGFSFTYDKRFYDRLLHDAPGSVRDHLRAAPEYQARSVRFLENHDEPRSLATFGPERLEAAAILCGTVPGMRFYYDGQLEGRIRSSPVQLGRWADEPVDERVHTFYQRLLADTRAPVFHDGEWSLLETTAAGDDTYRLIVASRWTLGPELRIAAVNLGDRPAQARLWLGPALRHQPPRIVLTDVVDGAAYPKERRELEADGLFVRLAPGRGHVFRAGRDAGAEGVE